MTWGVAFALTQGIEMPIYWVGTRSTDLAPLWRLAIGFGCSALTHPIVWFVLPGLVHPTLGFWGYFAVAETFAVLAEAAYLKAFAVPRPLLLALAANGTSALTGLLLTG